ncbi:CD63 antigen-like [Macrosteles quadrilineatus]|uniref:CD63 antigen-like n=1 Tax=Macrosteles quadrilineatus TaxID=74068 RepID=UPI0023E10C98|nr:CD63 antigen-like [Macrosteles quadrilineatus]
MGCSTIARYILIVINLVLALAGIGVVVVGVSMASGSSLPNEQVKDDLLQGNLSMVAIIFTVVGACVFIFAFMGCCGALQENHCMMCTYTVLLLTMLVLQIAGLVLAYKYKNETKELATNLLEASYEKYGTDNSTRSGVDFIQQEFKCCGSVNTSTPWNILNMTMPESCYPNKNITLVPFKTDCISTLSEKVKEKFSAIQKWAIILAVVQAIGVVFALKVASSIKRMQLRGYS